MHHSGQFIKTISILICSCLAAAFASAEARDTSSLQNLTHSIEMNVRPAFIMPTHTLYVRHNSMGERLLFSGSAHLQYSFAFSPESRYGRLFPDTYQGIGVGSYTFLCHEDIGSPVALYLFQNARVAQLAKNLSLNYEWNLGLSFGWHPNMAISSRINAYINVGAHLKWRLTPHWSLVAGPEYTHFSNGDTMYPNGGANTVGLRLGTKAVINPSMPSDSRVFIKEYESALRSAEFKDRVTYDIMAYGAWRADRMPKGKDMYVINKPFPLAGLIFNPQYHFTRNLSAGAALDLIYDSSANIYGQVEDEETGEVVSFRRPPFGNQIAAGLSLRAELTMPIFSVNLGGEYNFIRSGEDMHPFYAVFNLKTFVSQRLFLLVGYRLSTLQYTHNLMFGLGVRI